MEPTNHLLAEAKRFGYVADGGVWLRPTLGQPARQVGLVKESDDDALTYFARRYEAFRAKVDELLERMEASDNRGSFLMKVLHLKEQTLTFDALGDFATLNRRLQEAEESVGVSVARNREKNLATKISFIEQAEALRDSVEWVTAGETVKDLRQGWLKTGPVAKELTEQLDTRFQAAIQGFFDRRKEFQADKKAMARRTLDRYRDLVQQAEGLKESSDFEATSRSLKQLQQAWREVNGSLPKKQAAELWTRFRAANNHFFERLKVHMERQRATGGGPASPEQILARKRALAERIEALAVAPASDAVNQAKNMQAEWKQVGSVRGEESDRLWQRFMVACDRIFELSALEYYMRKRQATTPESLTPTQQAQARVVVLRDFLKSDSQELATLRDNLGNLSSAPANDSFRQMLQTKIRSLERKVRTKNDLIAEYSRTAAKS